MGKIRLLIVESHPPGSHVLRQDIQRRLGLSLAVCFTSREAAPTVDLEGVGLIVVDCPAADAGVFRTIDALREHSAAPILLVTAEPGSAFLSMAMRRNDVECVISSHARGPEAVMVVRALASLVLDNASLRRDLRDRIAQHEMSLKRMEEMAATDPLTGLYNRRHFSRVLDRLFAEAQRYDKDLACVMIDLDGYKRLNDTFGHQVGDQLLVLAGKVISANMRRMDVAARYGGDEFVLLLPHASCEEASGVVQRIRDGFRHASGMILRRNDGVTMSVGVASLREHGPSGADQLVALADAALYEAKDAGRNRIRKASSIVPV